ncbi:thiamine diphosphokinase [bacterium]|nr:thiamine diphosphokinase [bacterium]
MDDYALFLHGTYQTADLPFFKKLCDRRFRIAVDGGYAFFKVAGLTPDLLIGDLDSLGECAGVLPPDTAIISYPRDKDATDAELALKYCLERKARKVDIIQPSLGEWDHFLGNMFLLTGLFKEHTKGIKTKVRLISRNTEAFFIASDSFTIRDGVDELVSILPLSKRIVLSCLGTHFDVKGRTIRRGETIGLRNRIRSARATFDILGEAIICRHFSR